MTRIDIGEQDLHGTDIMTVYLDKASCSEKARKDNRAFSVIFCRFSIPGIAVAVDERYRRTLKTKM